MGRRAASQFNTLVTLQVITLEKLGTGGTRETVASTHEIWAKYMPTTGREIIASGRLESQRSAVFILRADPDLVPTAKDRILMNGVLFDIQYVAPSPAMPNEVEVLALARASQ